MIIMVDDSCILPKCNLETVSFKSLLGNLFFSNVIKKNELMRLKIVNGRVSKETYDLVEKKCKDMGLNKSQYVTSLILKDLGLEKELPKTKQQNESILDKLKKAFGVADDQVVQSCTPTVKTPKKEYTRYRSLNAIWEPSETVKRSHSNMEDRKYYFDYETGLIEYKAPNNVCYKCCSLNELLILQECNPIYRKDVVALRKLLKKHPADNSFAGLIYQYKNGMFDEIISNFKNNVGNCKFKIYSNKLWFMGVESTITVSTAKELISIIENKGFSEVLVHKLCKSYSAFNEVEVRIVCENYDNTQLLSLLKEPNKNVVLNNPSKRRNVIRNNGVI